MRIRWLAALAVVAAAVAGRSSCADDKEGCTTLTLDLKGCECATLPRGFCTQVLGDSPAGIWSVMEDRMTPSKTGRVLAQIATHDREDRATVCVHEKYLATDARISVRLRFVSGSKPSAGIILRYKDKKGYLLRADQEDRKVLLERFDGARYSSVKSSYCSDLSRSWKPWHGLNLVVKGKRFEFSIDDGTPECGEDDSLWAPTEAGKVGLWTRTDTVAHFDDLRVE